ncbi:MAG TPA: hypothetical protein DCG19_14830 [Cryomorphaceae bacterium]|nr:hypothetical protein [Owenweeksia sp.]MBG00594.1 hypothetical protein [Owenweeksia sp.]HAD98684.1 hypothetical protein [Cryomorphaceae bacterium]HBF18898.1 hypothetical protein [Cryomorphaceae bacterium]|tara:strand:+ start:1609 stop:2187 length:579 start_codon:yes stop_codon:yes gene_type:complete
MISRITYLRELRHELLHYKGDALREFYYLEAEDLRYKATTGQWNIIEVFEHMNLTNEYYIKTLSEAVEKAPPATTDTFSLSWFGEKCINIMRPGEDGKIIKVPTLKKIDPLHLQKKGKVLVEKIVFRDFIDGMEQLIELTENMESVAIDKVSVKTLLPLIRLPLGDALGFITAHTQRHIEQAYRLARQRGSH